MKTLLIVILLALPAVTVFANHEFIFPSKEGKIQLRTSKGLIAKNQTATFQVESMDGIDLFDLNITALNGSAAFSGTELSVNVTNESLIYLLVTQTDEATGQIKYYDLIGLPIAQNTYPYIAVYADNVTINPQRGIQGDTQNIHMMTLYNELQGSCTEVFVTEISVAFTDRHKEVGKVSAMNDAVSVSTLFNRGASPHLHLQVTADDMGCKNEKGAVISISPGIKKKYAYAITASNLDKDILGIINRMNKENAAAKAKNSQASNDS
ncbi:MAG: hypothetical protein RJQ09_03980 [Cyclobacteriaceae bacterium]